MRTTTKCLVVVVLPVLVPLLACGDGGGEDILAGTQDLEAIRLHYSVSPDRSNPRPLDSASLRGPVYIFSSPSTGVAKVDFYLDDPARQRAPYSVDEVSPYDFAGTAADGMAIPVRALFAPCRERLDGQPVPRRRSGQSHWTVAKGSTLA